MYGNTAATAAAHPAFTAFSPSVPQSTAAVNIGYCSSDAKDAHSIPVPASAP